MLINFSPSDFKKIETKVFGELFIALSFGIFTLIMLDKKSPIAVLLTLITVLLSINKLCKEKFPSPNGYTQCGILKIPHNPGSILTDCTFFLFFIYILMLAYHNIFFYFNIFF